MARRKKPTYQERKESQQLIERYNRAQAIFFVRMASFVAILIGAIIFKQFDSGAEHGTTRLFVTLTMPTWLIIFSALDWKMGIARASNTPPYYIARSEHPWRFWLHLSMYLLFGVGWLAICILKMWVPT